MSTPTQQYGAEAEVIAARLEAAGGRLIAPPESFRFVPGDYL